MGHVSLATRKGVYAYHLSLRARSPEAASEFCRRSREYLTRALPQHPGFLHGICLADEANPLSILIFEEWGNRESVQAWLQSRERDAIHKELMGLTEGPQTWHLTIYRELW